MGVGGRGGGLEAVAEEVEEAGGAFGGGGGFLLFWDVEDGFGPAFFVVEESGCGEEDDGEEYGTGL